MAALSSSSSPVEARSLSSITSIAANPPAYPRNPTQAKLDRVELYIVKVPGSKDVVLTPLKPPTKSNISIDAINSSFYYLHVATDEDKDFIRSVEQEQEEQARNGPRASRLPDKTVSRLNSFKRKPIGKQIAVAESEGSSSPSHGEGNVDLKHNNPSSAHPAVHSSDQRQFTNDENTSNVSSADVSASKPYIAQTKRKAVASDFKIPRRPVSASGLTKTTGLASNLVESRFPWDESREENMDKASSFCITLIRRDVASGSQWNVGTISSSKGDKGIIHVEITNPGYAKFRNNIPIPQISTSSHPASPVNDWHSSADVLKKMAQNMTHNMMHASDTERSAFSRDIIPVKHGLQGNSLTDVLFNRHSGSVEPPKFAQYVSAKVNRGYYSFQSPWGGTCSFVVSVNGGSLKCKHTIPGPAITADSTHGSASPNPEVTVAELRYNIPFALEQFRPPSIFGVNGGIKALEEDAKGKRAGLSQIISTNIQKVQQHTRARSHSQGAARIVSRPNEQGYDENRAFSAAAIPVAANEDRYDFSLARELAGGGMNGKSAKLGKLIIEDEGIKMIDLVVAASMGIWWRSTYQPS